MSSVTITLPLPSKNLSQNSRVHWRRRASATKYYRGLALAEMRSKIMPPGGRMPDPWPAAMCEARFYFKRNGRRDTLNFLASLKPAFDGVVDAGLIADDDASRLLHAPTVFDISKIRPRVELTFTRIEPPARRIGE